MPLNKEVASEGILQDYKSEYNYLLIIEVTYTVCNSKIVDECKALLKKRVHQMLLFSDRTNLPPAPEGAYPECRQQNYYY